MSFGSWRISSILYSQHGTTIYGTSMREWVIKAMTDENTAKDEVRALLAVLAHRPRHCIQVPQQNLTPESTWYVMRRYTGEVQADTFYKVRWRIIAQHVLQFLQDFHVGMRMIHMDIKRGNIMYDHDTAEFVVADYELADSPRPMQTRDSSDSYKWYYLSVGAELDQPTVAWRMDLVALGYVLGSILAEPDAWTFEQLCREKRHQSTPMSESELLALRDKEVAAVNPVIAAYMERVATVAWDSAEPPPRTFYRELEALFVDRSESFTPLGPNLTRPRARSA